MSKRSAEIPTCSPRGVRISSSRGLTVKPRYVRNSVLEPVRVRVDLPVVEAVLEERRGLPLELGVLGGGLGVGVLDARHEPPALLGLAQGGGDELGLAVPRREVVRAALHRRDRRRQRRQLLVVGLLHAAVRPDDEVGRELGDALELEAVGEAQDRRLRAAEAVLRPGPDGRGLVAVPLGRRDRDLAEREDDVLLGVADDGDPLGGGGDGRRAEAVLDGDRERGGRFGPRGPLAGGGGALVVGAAGGQRDGREQQDQGGDSTH